MDSFDQDGEIYFELDASLFTPKPAEGASLLNNQAELDKIRPIAPDDLAEEDNSFYLEVDASE